MTLPAFPLLVSSSYHAIPPCPQSEIVSLHAFSIGDKAYIGMIAQKTRVLNHSYLF